MKLGTHLEELIVSIIRYGPLDFFMLIIKIIYKQSVHEYSV